MMRTRIESGFVSEKKLMPFAVLEEFGRTGQAHNSVNSSINLCVSVFQNGIWIKKIYF